MEHELFSVKRPTASLIGLGRSHISLADYLLDRGVPLTVRDVRPFAALGSAGAALLARGVRFFCGKGYLSDIFEPFLFLSPSVRPDLAPLLAAKKRGATLTSEAALFAELCPCPRLAVTGSDGKTTTTTLAGLLLAEEDGEHRHTYVGGNIGRPLISLLPQLTQEDLVAEELSSFQLMTKMPPPARAVITNLTENHLNWHSSMAEYAAAKATILGPDTAAVLYADDPWTATQTKGRRAPTLFSLTKSADALHAECPNCHTITISDGDIIAYDSHPVGRVGDILLPGRHNLLNYMAALGLVYPYLRRPNEAFFAVASRFRGVPHRLEPVAERNGVRYYNSSIDSTPSRTAASIAALDGRLILLCGGMDKGLSFAPLRRALVGRARAVLLFGAARRKIANELTDSHLRVEEWVTMSEAVHAAMRLAEPGDRVLLSPACTSFDEFQNFEERGDVFRRLILENIGG